MVRDMMKLSETVNKDDANFLLNLNDEDFETLVWLEETKHNKGEPYKPKAVYIKQAKSYLKQHLEQATCLSKPVKKTYEAFLPTKANMTMIWLIATLQF